MRHLVAVLFSFIIPIGLLAQNPNGDFNPYLSDGTISPFPLVPLQGEGIGTFSFKVGNSGDDPLTVFNDHFLQLTITLSYGIPATDDPITAIDGDAAGFFNWEYNNGTYTAKQITEIPAHFSGSITIDYRVGSNSDSPGLNGFNVNICPAPYHTDSNLLLDDAESVYTYTDESYLAPAAPASIYADTIGEDIVRVSWPASSDQSGDTQYRIYRDNELIGFTDELFYTDSTVNILETYEYGVTARSSEGYESKLSTTVTVHIIDLTAPTVPLSLDLTSVTSDGVVLNWEASVDNVEVVGYSIYRNGANLTTVEPTSYTDVSVETGSVYTYSVSAKDAAGNESGLSDQVTVSITNNPELYLQKLVLTPNPNQGIFMIELERPLEECMLEIIDARGKILIQEQLDMVEQTRLMNLDYSHLSTGQYIIRLYNEQNFLYEKLMIIK